MKNFGTLYGYELKKLLRRKLAWIMVLVIAALMAYTARPVSDSGGANFSLTDRAGNTVSKYVSIAEQREQVSKGKQSISGQIMDEQFFQNVREASNGNGLYIIKKNFDLDSYFHLVDSSYYGPYAMIAFQTGLDPAETSAEDFYRNRQETIELQYGGRTDREVAYWQNMEAQVEKPFVYRYISGYQDILADVFGLSNVIPLVAAVCLCGVFSEEKRMRADALIFSSRQGRFPQYLAKVLAGITIILAATILVIGADAAAVLLTQGWDGFDAVLQLENLNSSLPISIGQATLIMLGLLLLYGLLCGGVTMLFSAFTQHTAAALAAPVLLMICQAWLRLDVQAAEYLPNQLFNTTPSLCNRNLVNLFGRYLNNLQFGFVLYGGLAAVLLALCWLGWRRSAKGI